MAIDPVCGMTVDEASAVGTSLYEGRTFYFCSPHCLRAFEANPKPFVALGAPRGTAQVAVGHAMPAAPDPAKAPNVFRFVVLWDRSQAGADMIEGLESLTVRIQPD